MTERLVLIFAYHYPPENSVGGARPFRFAKYLSRLGYTCCVFTAAEQVGRGDFKTVYVPDPFFKNPRHTLGWQLERAVRKVLLPGEMGIRWSYLAYRSACSHVRVNSSAQITILSTSPPLGPHLAAWQLARDKGWRWIADFRDPLSGDGVKVEAYRWVEGFVLGQANVVIANTDSALLRWQHEFPLFANKAHLIWNGFDPEERLAPLPIPARDYKLLSHVGELYIGRNATPILESVSRLIGTGRLQASKLRVQLIGPVDASSLPGRELLLRGKRQRWLEFVSEQIPKRDACHVAQTSDGLLLLQPQSRIQVPGKLFEYLQIGRPILAFVQRDSPAERLLERSGVPYQCVYPDSRPEETDDAVVRFFSFPSTPVTPSPWFEEEFNSENQTRIVDDIIRKLHENGRAT